MMDKNGKRRCRTAMIAMLALGGVGTVWLCDVQPARAESDSDFQIEEGVLKAYTGTTAEIVVVPEGVTEIGFGAFCNHDEIKRVTLPDGVKKIKTKAFFGCKSLQQIDIPEGVTDIDYSTFVRCESLERIDLPKTLTFLGGGAFADCIRLKSIEIPEKITQLLPAFIEDDKDFMASYTYNMPDGYWADWDYCTADYIGIGTFDGCTSLEKVILPESISSIQDCTFENCTSLTSINIPSAVVSWGVDVFRNCTSLKGIVFPEGIQKLPPYGFRGCDLDYVTIPKTVKSLYPTTFYQANVKEIRETHPPETFPFTDVKRGGWQENTVWYMLDHKLMRGTGDTTFAPGVPMTRGQLVGVLWNMAGQPQEIGTMPFADVSARNTFYKAILWAGKNKIINGYANGSFGPKDPLTREQIAAILLNYAKYCGKNTDNGGVELCSYRDGQAVSHYMLYPMQWAVNHKIISGKYNGTMLDPKGAATRIEVAAMVMNFYKNIK